jgi:TonB-dependent starch-binding outer membrane protein SusC
MVSSNARAAFFGGLLASLTVGCIGNTPPPGSDLPEPSATRPLVGTVVTSDDIDRVPNQPIEKTLQARVAGVTIVTTPDGGIAVRIRGATTINGDTQPLYVIDGMPVQAGPSGSLVGINPHDIASIEVLKDAASLAFYGVRAANGVILIKTKHAN